MSESASPKKKTTTKAKKPTYPRKKIVINCATDRETRLASGLDLEGKSLLHDKADLIRFFVSKYTRPMGYGAQKYEYSNFEKTDYGYREAIDCCRRHVRAVVSGELIDFESEIPHIELMMARAAFAIMKFTRSKVDTKKCDSDPAEYVGYDIEKVQPAIGQLVESFPFELNNTTVTEYEPAPVFSSIHVTPEMLDALGKNKLWSTRDTYDTTTVAKILSILFVDLLGQDEITEGQMQALFDNIINFAYLVDKQSA